MSRSDLTANEVCTMLDGMERDDMPRAGLIRDMKQSGLVGARCADNQWVTIFGFHNVLLRVNRGAVITHNEIRASEIDNERCFIRAVRNAETRNFGLVPLSFETNADHEVFSVIDDDTLFCMGIVFNLNQS